VRFRLDRARVELDLTQFRRPRQSGDDMQPGLFD